MFEIGWTELLVIGIVALVVVGPKDLPVMFRTFGRFTARLRAMARDFQRAMEQAADDSGIKDVASDLKNTTTQATSGIDKLKMAADKFEKWDPTRPVSSAAKIAGSAAMDAVTKPDAAAPAAAAADATVATATTAGDQVAVTPASGATTPATPVAPADAASQTPKV